MIESVDLVRNGNAPKIVQDDSKATYESWCKASDVVVDWTADVGTVYNMIRGADPQPGANTSFNGTKLSLYDVEGSSYGSEGREPGAIVEIGIEKIVVTTTNGSVAIGRVRAKGGKKIGASEWAESVDLKVGDTFGGGD
jgi:methionyl-tRNA formyltransferase